ncbi:sigma-54-dependent Fis family transcriptional regulator [Ideonella sp. B7]|uniref:sigma-54-dependent transcriptional regulator n=1 Tax=Ideonella benzenivorans TaxID=2831643 RepID=UPI001CEC992C|nr:sigma-54 dependent transcriptional regulator [Ideonella benzenivorans]MCA6218866.1 sigma-54-dependent Fis family transcriptional regulator [Ideonella benzenivorans]
MNETHAIGRVLVVDDEPDLLTLYELTLLREGHEVEVAASVGEAWDLLRAKRFGLVITDMRLPDGSGMTLLHRLEEARRPEKVIVITAYGSAENAVEALKAGAFDYLTKPVDLRQFRSLVAAALGRVATPVPPAQPAGPQSVAPLARLVGRSAAMAEVRALVEKVARSMAPVLVQGESGTGKELVARAIHEVSPRAGQAFVAVNCGAIPEHLLEAEFFGYRKGAFTGAQEDRAGFFQAAHGGTLFLDEIGDLPLAMQSKLLRVIQERAVRPVGAVSETPLNVRIVSATHKDLAAEVAAGRFRQDLFYRVNVIRIEVPPLRDRLEDLGDICHALLERIARDAGVWPAPRLAGDALARLARYQFPGNVRELENLLHRAVALSAHEVIEADDLGLPDALLGEAGRETESLPPLRVEPGPAPADEGADVTEPLPCDLAGYLDEVERAILVRALRQHGFNRTAAGASLGLSLRQMRYRMARLAITEGDGVPELGPR